MNLSPGREPVGPVLVQQGRPADLVVFFIEHHRQLRRYLIAQGCADSDSDDIAQDAFLIVGERWATIAYYDRPKAYLYKVAIRLWHRHSTLSRRIGYRDDHENYLKTVPDPADPIAEVDLADTLTRWFRQLPRQGFLRIPSPLLMTRVAALIHPLGSLNAPEAGSPQSRQFIVALGGDGFWSESGPWRVVCREMIC